MGRLIDNETLDQYQKSLDEDAHWLTEYAQGKGPNVGQRIIDITVTMYRAAWAFRELMKEQLADDSGSYDALLPSAQPEQIVRDIATIIENEKDMRVILKNARLIDKQELFHTITAGIIATSAKDVYSCGMRNGMRWCRALLEEGDPKFEDASLYAQPEIIRCRDCISYQEGIDINGRPFTRCNGSDTSVRTYGQTPPDWYCADAKRRSDG